MSRASYVADLRRCGEGVGDGGGGRKLGWGGEGHVVGGRGCWMVRIVEINRVKGGLRSGWDGEAGGKRGKWERCELGEGRRRSWKVREEDFQR